MSPSNDNAVAARRFFHGSAWCIVDAMVHSPQLSGTVVLYSGKDPQDAGSHETQTRLAIAARLAALRGSEFAGHYDPAYSYAGRLYFVPGDTLTTAEARELGISSEGDLFGGVVPQPFIATKVITHPLVTLDAAAPEGWSQEMAKLLPEEVLPGFSVFATADARRAAASLLQLGRARLKKALGIGGAGQSVIASLDELDALLDAMDGDELRRHGVVIEQNLEQVTTYSVGEVHVAGARIAYYGTQRLTPNHRGADVYGGSDLVVVRERFDSLLELQLDEAARQAISEARRYDAAAMRAFPGFMASRRNYDVVHGLDREGLSRSGVLEQSWRIGGASPAEIAALEAFRAEPQRHSVRASCYEVYGECVPPPHATVCFNGDDPRVGRLTKYSLINEHTGGANCAMSGTGHASVGAGPETVSDSHEDHA